MDPLASVNAGWAESPISAPRAPSPPPPATSGAHPHTPNTADTLGSTHIRDPQVYGDPGTPLMHPSPPPSNEKPAPFLRVRIGALERNRKDLLIRYDASTNLPNFRTSLYRNMQRSYVEFQRFAEQAQLVCPQTIIPALPLPHTAAATDEEDDRLVRIALQRWFSRVCDDPVLQKEDELRSFIESDFGYQPVPPPSSRRQNSTTAATQLVTAALSKVVRRGPLDDDDDLASAKTTLEKLEPAWQGLANSVGNLGKARKALATSTSEVGGKLIALATDEGDVALATAERKMGRVYDQLSSMVSAQISSENVVLNDSLAYQALNAKSAREALAQRVQILEDSQNATKAAINKRRNVERLKGSSSINPIKVDEAITDMDEAVSLETQLNSRLNAISQNLHRALSAHSRNAHEDVAVSLLEHARMSIIFNRQVLRELEALKPDLTRVSVPTSPLPVMSPLGQASMGAPSLMAPPGPRFAHPQQQHHGSNANANGALPPLSASTITPTSAASAPGSGPGPGIMAQSMFLPPAPRSAGSVPGTPGVPGTADPLGMTQSMMLPGRPTGRPAPRRLDERKAAKLLAGGF